MIVSIIAAITQNGIVGNNGKMPWKCPEEMKFFKEKTTNHVVIMGRKTWDSLYVKPLPNRYNIVITRNSSLYNINEETQNGPTFVPSVEDALNYADGMTTEVFLIGGTEIWKHALDMDYVDRMYINILKKEYNGDTYFPYYNKSIWISEKSDTEYTDFIGYTLFKKQTTE